VLFKNTKLVANVDRNDRVGIRRGLADRELGRGARRAPTDDQTDGDRQSGKQLSATERPDHGFLLT